MLDSGRASVFRQEKASDDIDRPARRTGHRRSFQVLNDGVESATRASIERRKSRPADHSRRRRTRQCRLPWCLRRLKGCGPGAKKARRSPTSIRPERGQWFVFFAQADDALNSWRRPIAHISARDKFEDKQAAAGYSGLGV